MSTPDKHSPCLLIVDDDLVSRDMLRRVLSQFDYTIIEAENGQQGLELYRQFHPTIVLLDAMMPGLNGFETCVQLQTLSQGTPVPVIMITALNDDASIENAFRAGATDYISKPVHWPSLIQRVKRLIQTSQAVEALEAERALLRTVIDNLPDYIHAKDLKGRFILGNVAYAQAAHVSKPEDIIGKTAFDFFPQDLAEEYHADDRKVLDEGEVLLNLDRTIIDAFGDERPILTTQVPILNQHGEVQGLVALSHDVTEQKRLEHELKAHRDTLEKLVEKRTHDLLSSNEALQTSEDQLRQITDNMLDIICQADAHGIIQYASPSCRHVIGYSPAELQGKTVFFGLHPDEADAVIAEIKSTGRSEHRYRHSDGEYIWLETLCSLVFDEQGDVKRVVYASRDITHRKRAERELQELDQLKTDFLSTAAHELRTPLTSIEGFSELLLARQMDEDRQRRYLALINEQAAHLHKIIDDLLDVSRLEAKRQLTLTLEPTDLAMLMNEVALPFIEAGGDHEITFEGFGTCPPVLGDRTRLTQVGKNLLSNAIKYSPTGSTITIRLNILPDSLQVSIQDQGIGLTPEQQAHLFEKFYRADASNTAVGGTGLGLAICQLIIELHGGKIWVESERGAGSTFHFMLPLTPVQELAS